MSPSEEVISLITSAKTIVIGGHNYPDGDCFGAQIALRESLRLAFPDKKVYAVGSGMPSLGKILGSVDRVEDDVFDDALGILVDVSCVPRLEDQRMARCANFIKIDHHEPNPEGEGFPYLTIVDSSRISACEILFDFLEEHHLPINSVIASALYTGILTDSGRFVYHGVTPKTMEIVGKLFRYGIPAKEIIEICYYETPNEKAFKKWMRDNAVLDGQVCYLWACPEDYHRFDLTFEVASSFVNALAGKFSANIFVYFCVREDSWTRIEYRSNRCYPVCLVAKAFGGGGHRYASGGEIVDGKPSFRDIIRALNELPGDNDVRA
ncbi:MAG: bifunctional oligoribonuclease/PAP phosphatase NrnA [Candidatus Enteromonas sp.]|nr:bifunctional oligoribonuclease/PAP phosphatase NrnA [Candidatus Enteromonas sp.]